MATTNDVINNLSNKLAALTQSSGEQVLAFADATDAERTLLQAQIYATSLEQTACQQRIQDIQATQAFVDPGAAQEASLLAAIQAVGALVAATAAVGAVITAADNLVKAYSAKSTKP
ncbi:MAG: hypothetical protein ACHP84_00845 [Caulobacterales bacterium]